ncbi:MAG: UDP-N-acetyl glucosamine 2-epimerase [Methanobacteriota archaeon]|nr:MAG: UDP-N-acetyl glucosamine 2-epimerase [Euryarchaeota archaeon]
MKQLDVRPGRYALLTFHRQENVDRKEILARSLDAFERVIDATGLEIIFPVHPRTKKRLLASRLAKRAASIRGLRRIEPTGYLDFLMLEKHAALVLTDSGGLQEESCFFRVPCVTLRENTERPETLKIRANVLAGTDPARVEAAALRQLNAPRKWPNPFGDGHTGERIARIMDQFLG